MGAVKKKIRCGGRPMTAIVLAGGRGRRMKADKAGLDVGGRTLLEHVLGQIGPHFDEVLVSITPGQKLAPVPGLRTLTPLGPDSPSGASAPQVRIVEDEEPGLGPLGGLLVGLKTAKHEACAVVACDIPDIDKALLRSLAEAAADAAIAVPVGPSGLYEPLFAVYRRSIIPEIESLLGRGERSLLPLYQDLPYGRGPFRRTRPDPQPQHPRGLRRLSSIARGPDGGPAPGRERTGQEETSLGKGLKRSVPGPGHETVKEEPAGRLRREHQDEGRDQAGPEPGCRRAARLIPGGQDGQGQEDRCQSEKTSPGPGAEDEASGRAGAAPGSGREASAP